MSGDFKKALKEKGLDPRRTLARADAADAALEGKVSAASYLAPEKGFVRLAKTPLLAAPAHDAARETELIYGEPLAILDEREGFFFLQSKWDGYVGYADKSAIEKGALKPDHKVCVPKTFIYPEPDIKKGPLGILYLGAELLAAPSDNPRFMALKDGGYVYASHLAPIADMARDFVSVAEGYMGVPYLWGGKTHDGLDCSALVQISMRMAGLFAPRDTDMMWDELGEKIADGAPQIPLKRGDLVFWQGHVGIMQSETQFIHANGYHMQVASEPLSQAIERIAALYGDVRGVKRLAI